jgi:hypothetical protein
MIDHDLWSMEDISRVFDGDPDRRFGLSRDDVLDNITFYWLTNARSDVARSLIGGNDCVAARQGQPPGGTHHAAG